MHYVLKNILVPTTIWKNYQQYLLKTDMHSLYPSTSTPRCSSTRNEYIDYPKDMYKNIHRSTIHNRPRLETAKRQ